MLIGDFNAEEPEACLSQFLFEMNIKNIVKEPTCYKSLSNPSCIDCIIIEPKSVQLLVHRCNYFKDFHKDGVLGPMLFNIFINDMLFALSKVNICKFANDTTLYVCYSNLKSVLEKLEHNSELATTSFEIDYMKLNTVKCNLMVLGNKNDYM